MGSNCWAVHGNFTKSGKPILAGDPHLVKYTSPTWYGTRLSWNETSADQASYRTYIAGASLVGTPVFTHLKTPFLATCLTALNPDAQDLFLEDVKEEKYLASDGTWKSVEKIHEVIKVRFGSDVHFEVRYTDNGVLLPKDILHKETNAFTMHLMPEMW
jgi:penicillin amidase